MTGPPTGVIVARSCKTKRWRRRDF
jgi:hypothetical protein